MVEYRYDAWGRLLAATGSMAGSLGKYNPFRYRGYIYDEETGLYWLRSRYYNPEWKRFVNADSTDVLTADPMGLAGKNLFAYCDNNPVVRIDANGKKAFAIGGVFSAAFFIGASYSAGYCWDDKGNFGAYYTYVGLPHEQKWSLDEATVSMAGISASMGFSYQEYPTKSIKQLAEHGTFYGMGVDTMGYSCGVDGLNTTSAHNEYAQMIRDKRPLDGIQYSWNLGVGWELAHTGISFTYIMLIFDEGKYIPSWKRKLQSAF